MATKDFKVRAPDGSIITVRAPETATQEQVFRFAKMQFEQESGVDSQESRPLGRTGAAEKVAEQRRNEREAYLAELEKTNPFQAQALREMSGGEQALIQIGAGFRDVARGLGLIDRPLAGNQRTRANPNGGAESVADPNEQYIQQLIPETAQLRTVGQAAPFLPAMIGASGATAGLGLGARAGTQAGLGSLEGATIARGTGGDEGDVLAGALTGGAIGGGAEVLGPYVNRAFSALARKVTGRPPKGIAIDDAGRPTKEFQKILKQEGKTFDQFVQEAAQEAAKTDESVRAVVEAGRANRPERAVDQISESVNLDRLAAAERLGMGDAPLAVISDDMATQELSGILSAVPGSEAGAALNQFTEAFGQRADSYIDELGGSIDRGMIDQDLLVNMQNDIKRIKALENRLYDRIRSDIGEGTMVNAKSLKNLLSARARTLQGVKNLSKVERDVLDRIKDGKITYASLDDLIGNVGAALGKETDAYSNVQTAKLKDMYSKLSQMRDGVAETFGHKTDMQRAKRIGAARFGLQESTQALFGRDLQKSIFPAIDRSVKGLEKGRVREFTATMELIPEKFRKPVAATMLNTALTGGRNQSLGVNSGQFATWFKNLDRNQSAVEELKKYIGEDAYKRLEDIANVAQGVANVTGSRVRTGVASEALKRLDDIDGIVGKVYNATKRVQGAPIVGRVAAVVGNTAKTLTMEKTPAIEAAQDIMGSKKFADAVKEAAKNGVESRTFKRLNSQLKATPEYKKYLRYINEDAKAQIAASGLISWLASDREDE